MRHTWRWFGEHDVVGLQEIEQAGATGVVTALHHIDNGDVWTIEDIQKRQDLITKRKDGSSTSLHWDVVESLPVSEEIKKQDGEWRLHIENYKRSLENFADGHVRCRRKRQVCAGPFRPLFRRRQRRRESSRRQHHQQPNRITKPKCLSFMSEKRFACQSFALMLVLVWPRTLWGMSRLSHLQ